MTNTATEINAFLENSRKLAEPMTRLQALSARSFERFARYGYEAAGDYLNFGIAAAHAATQSKDAQDFFKKQTELANGYFEKHSQRSQDLLKIATEAQSDVTQWIDQASTEFAARTSKTAKAA
jgi:hypothetical protein